MGRVCSTHEADEEHIRRYPLEEDLDMGGSIRTSGGLFTALTKLQLPQNGNSWVALRLTAPQETLRRMELACWHCATFPSQSPEICLPGFLVHAEDEGWVFLRDGWTPRARTSNVNHRLKQSSHLLNITVIPWPLVRKWTIPTERPALFGEI
jgi:hypothetical protein